MADEHAARPAPDGSTFVGLSRGQLLFVCFGAPVGLAVYVAVRGLDDPVMSGLLVVGGPLMIVVGVANYLFMRRWGLRITPAELVIHQNGTWFTGGPPRVPWSAVTAIEETFAGVRIETTTKTYRCNAPCRRYLGLIPDPAFASKLAALRRAQETGTRPGAVP